MSSQTGGGVARQRGGPRIVSPLEAVVLGENRVSLAPAASICDNRAPHSHPKATPMPALRSRTSTHGRNMAARADFGAPPA